MSPERDRSAERRDRPMDSEHDQMAERGDRPRELARGQKADTQGASSGGEDARRRLAQAQTRVLAALVGGAEPPEGFDPERIRVQAASLDAKRRSVVARLRSDAARAAGPHLVREFAAYAASRTTPPPGYRADADDFAAWLQAKGVMDTADSGGTRDAGNARGAVVQPSWWRRLLGLGRSEG